MKIVMGKSTEEAIDIVASKILDKVKGHPASVIGLATGKTMEPVYAKLVATARKNDTSLGKSFFFMLDEYLGLKENDPSSFKSYIQKHLQKPLSLGLDQFSFPPVHAQSMADASIHYELSLKESGGVDLQLLGIGRNGHIGFNEPGSLKNSRTRIVKLTDETIEANRSQFVSGVIPREAMSMGIGTILEAKELVLLATGKSKADAIKHLLNHHDDPSCPVTYLKGHANFTLVLDPEAASKINLNI